MNNDKGAANLGKKVEARVNERRLNTENPRVYNTT